jgi:dynein heavy chain
MNPYGKQFDFSESAIFGKFDQFCWRIQKLIDLFTTVQQFSALDDSTIENIEPIVEKFNKILTEFRRKKYNFLDYRNESFDNDYVDFNYKIQGLESELVNFINAAFSSSTNTRHSLNLLYQFRRVLKQENLQRLLDEKYRAIFSRYGKDVERIMKMYNVYKDNPPYPRNAPKVSGSIAWSRQLLRKVEQPMEMFKKTPSLVEGRVSTL